MKNLDDHCEPGKCCICMFNNLCLGLDDNSFRLASKDKINTRLSIFGSHYQTYEKALMRKTLDDMVMEERETKEKEYMDNREILKELDEAIKLNREARTKNNDAMCHAKNALSSNRRKPIEDYAYKAGLEEAWEIARKITLYHEDGGYSCDELKYICGDDDPYKAYKNLSIHGVKEKIAAYEAEQAKPKLGDVVKFVHKSNGITTYIGIYCGSDDDFHWLLIRDHKTPSKFPSCVWTIEKTGKHFDIQSMLDEIG